MSIGRPRSPIAPWAQSSVRLTTCGAQPSFLFLQWLFGAHFGLKARAPTRREQEAAQGQRHILHSLVKYTGLPLVAEFLRCGKDGS